MTVPAYREDQRFSPWWLLVLLGSITLLLLALGSFAVPGWAIVGVIAVLLFSVRLRTEVREDGVYVKLWPIHRSFRRIPWADIERHGPIEYNSLLRFGGWGLRITPSTAAYNVGGNSGVTIERSGQRTIVIGSERPEELSEAITTQFTR